MEAGLMGRIAHVALTCLAMFLAALMGAASASATPPTHEALPPFESPGVIDCGNFQDNFVDFFTGTQTTFYDMGGDPVRLVQHVEHHSNDVNSVTGLTIHEHGHFTFTVDLIAETVTITGNQEVANRRSAGVVVQDVGRAVFDFDDNLLFFAGGRNHSELFGGDQVLCDALS
jgi:hypothetical protein